MKATPRNLIRLGLLIVLAFLGQYTASQTLVNRELKSLDPAQVLGEISPTPPPDFYQVTKIVDGDTIKVDINGQTETVRLLSIDSPEVHKPGTPVQCYGPEATDHLSLLLADGIVRLEPDTKQGDRDRYQRLLRYVYLPDGSEVNSTMVKDGYARAYTTIKSDQLPLMLELQQQAQDQHLGLWSACQ